MGNKITFEWLVNTWGDNLQLVERPFYFLWNWFEANLFNGAGILGSLLIAFWMLMVVVAIKQKATKELTKWNHLIPIAGAAIAALGSGATGLLSILVVPGLIISLIAMLLVALSPLIVVYLAVKLVIWFAMRNVFTLLLTLAIVAGGGWFIYTNYAHVIETAVQAVIGVIVAGFVVYVIREQVNLDQRTEAIQGERGAAGHNSGSLMSESLARSEAKAELKAEK